MPFRPIQRGQSPSGEHVIELQRAISEMGIWTDWIPTVTQGVSVTKTTTEAKYAVIGKTCHLYAKIAITGAGTAGQIITIGGIPTAAQITASVGSTIGIGKVLDSATANYVGEIENTSTSTLVIVPHGLTSGVGITPSFALASGDAIGFSATYRIA